MKNANNICNVRKPYQSIMGPWFVVEYECNGKKVSKGFWDIIKAYAFFHAQQKQI